MFVKYLVNGSFPADFFERYRSSTFVRRSERMDSILRVLDSLRDRSAVFDLERYGERDPSLIELLFDAGIFTLLVPNELGGEGATLEEYATAMQKLAELSLSLTVTAVPHSGMGCKAVLRYGTEDQKRIALSTLVEKRNLVSFALTEAEAGSDIANIKTTARLDGEEFVLDGSKTWITNAGWGGSIVVLAKTPQLSPQPDAITFFLLTGEEEGLIVRQPYPKMALYGSVTSELFLQGVRVPKSAAMGAIGKGAAQFNVLVGAGRLGVACGAIGLLRKAREHWVTNRLRPDDRGLFAVDVLIYQMEALVALCSQPIGLDESEQTVYSGMAKLFCTQKSWETIHSLVDDFPSVYLSGEFEEVLNFCQSPVLRVTEGPNEVIAFRCGLDLVFAATGIPEASSDLRSLVDDRLGPYAQRIDTIVRAWKDRIAEDSSRFKPLAAHQGVLENVVDGGIEVLKCVSVLWRIVHERDSKPDERFDEILEVTIREAENHFESGGTNRFDDELVNVLYA